MGQIRTCSHQCSLHWDVYSIGGGGGSKEALEMRLDVSVLLEIYILSLCAEILVPNYLSEPGMSLVLETIHVDNKSQQCP